MATGVPFKCYYGNEIRRINLPAGDRQIAYSSLIEQLQHAFSIPPTQQLRLRWLDDEGDKVSLTTSDELMDAVHSLIDRHDRKPGQAVRMFVTAVDPTEVHEGVTCDGCGCGVTGHRFKCALCPNYDLCTACVATNTHNQHPMLLIRRSCDFAAAAPFGGCRRRWGGGCGPRFRNFMARAAADVAAAAAAAADAVTTATGASSDAAAAAAASQQAQPPPPPPPPAAATEEAMATDASGCHGNETPDPRVARALAHMQAMGFNDDGGWLTRLLVAKEGDISAVLDAIRPAK